jgi:hypothetical protein
LFGVLNLKTLCMKKLFFVPLIAIFVSMGCSKEKQALNKNESNFTSNLITTLQSDQLLQVRGEIMKELLIAAQDSFFRTLVLNACLEQRNGDYYVRLIDLALILESHSDFHYLRSRLIDLDAEVISITHSRHPILFYPRAETIEDLLHQGVNTISIQQPIGVFQEMYFEDYSSPGYSLDGNHSLKFFANITEKFAWQHDVWVIGEEENIGSDSIEVLNLSTESTNGIRTQGRSEFGGIIQITNLNAIEHWTSGKLELELRVFGSNGALISHRYFGQRARRNFQNQVWFDFDHFICNWNTSTFGNWMYENWIERDGGLSSTITLNFPAPQGQSGPSTSFTITSKSGDDNLGLATVQFTDLTTQVYNLTHSNIRRK